MVTKILLPQEIETFYVIPTIRRYLALYMKELGMKQKDIAELLGINTAAISQYRSSKRGNKVRFNMKIKAEIKKSAASIVDKASYIRETQRIIFLVRASKTLCQIHKKFSLVPKSCKSENMGCS